ncbi:restriction endonuclease [Photobacterium sp.]|uniref:nSTAND3 domain-containing NTPase n=1 Tax=Photobacterium sp. TaxID=660 RepID=UPI00299D9A94|nr:restriction endonuclease [Photobacterium sp.]MDX1302900.1 restriction endonuclease [Photobacterium sp.]
MATVQATDVTYELHTLGWKAFQQLCSTVLSSILGQTVQSFSEVNDGGRDLAFYGIWDNVDNNESFNGSFTVQCKHTIKPDANFSLSHVKHELSKVQALVNKGLCDNYFIFTNAKVSADAETKIVEAFQNINGIKVCRVFTGQWLSQKITESPKLRMLVPRVYGLGDLSQIVDERAYVQANEILSSMGGDIAKFVITDAYSQSVKALIENGFVLLLGDPASGKSTIAASLVLSSIDRWESRSIKVSSPEEFKKHWNPNEINQVFWVDDVFGATQLDFSKATDWNSALSHLNTAIGKGTKIIFTSRTYIYREAKEYLKEHAVPVLRNSQVTIYVEKISRDEREQILYNHIKLGNQNKNYKTSLKPFLKMIVESSGFSPEVARRLGDKQFTKNLNIDGQSVTRFISNPMGFLADTINNLDVHCKAALTVLFMNGGEIESPVKLEVADPDYINRLGSSLHKVIKALTFLEGSFTTEYQQGGQYFWKFKHPTIQDALANKFSSDREFLNEYLLGADLIKIFREVSCGVSDVEGVKIVVPKYYYSSLIERMMKLDRKNYMNNILMSYFLSEKCDSNFLQELVETNPAYVSSLGVYSKLKHCSELKVILKLNLVGLLKEELRISAAKKLSSIAINQFDSGIFEHSINSLLTDIERGVVFKKIKSESILNIYNEIDNYAQDWDGEEAEEYFSDLESAIKAYKTHFVDEESMPLLEEAEEFLNECKSDIESKFGYDCSNSHETFTRADTSAKSSNERCIFDDVDC